jgi:inhibitor of KinA sporulation pathway (predicted exonuclease)
MVQTGKMIVEKGQYDRALYIDLEWSCWDGPIPHGRTAEIIEIGVVELDLVSLKITREASYLVRPRHLDISAACTKITGLCAEDLRSAPRLPEVVTRLENEFGPQDKICGTWGDDAEIFAQACHQHKLRSPLRNISNVSQMFWRLSMTRQQPSLVSAVEHLGLSFHGVAHTAVADARNTARVHAEMIRRIRRESEKNREEPLAISEQAEITAFGKALLRAFEQQGKLREISPSRSPLFSSNDSSEDKKFSQK